MAEQKTNDRPAGCGFGRDTRKLLFALLGVLCALLLATVGMAGSAHGAAGAARKEASALQVNVAQHEDRWTQLGPRLQRIEDKLDRLLEGRHSISGRPYESPGT